MSKKQRLNVGDVVVWKLDKDEEMTISIIDGDRDQAICCRQIYSQHWFAPEELRFVCH